MRSEEFCFSLTSIAIVLNGITPYNPLLFFLAVMHFVLFKGEEMHPELFTTSTFNCVICHPLSYLKNCKA